MDKYCIITGEKLTPANDSKAHVIPSALGWRFKPKGVLSKNGNTEIGDKIDLPMIAGFAPIASLLNVSRDRGNNQPVTMKDELGRSYVVKFGEPLALTEPAYESTATADGGRSICIKARTLKELRQLLKRAVKEVRGLDIDEAIAHAAKAQGWPAGMLRSQIQIGPASMWPSLFVGASIFAASQGCDVHPDLQQYVKGFDPENPALPPDTFYFAPAEAWLLKGGAVSHVVALVTDAKKQQALAYLEVFNTAGVAVVLPYTGTEDTTAVEAVDVLNGQKIDVAVDAPRVRALDWAATHRLGEAAFNRLQEVALNRLVATGQRLASEAAHLAASHDIVGGSELSMSARDLVALVERLADYTILMAQRVGLTTADLDSNLHGFEKVCEDIEATMPFGRRCLFAAAIAPSRRKLRDAIEVLKGLRR